jgi:hypothetical protein
MLQVVRKLFISLGLISLVVFIFFQLYNNNKNTVAIAKATIPSKCSLENMSCSVSMSDGQILLFDLVPKGLPAMEPLMLTITGSGLNQKPLKIWFEGKDMNMGKHFMLPVTSQNQLSNAVSFKGMIPVCTLDKDMQWLLNIELTDKHQLYHIQFQL